MGMGGIYGIFPDRDACIDFLEKSRWGGRPRCPYCHSSKSTPLRQERRYHCNDCNTSYSVTVGTVFHKSRVDLQRWFRAISIMGGEGDVSSRRLSELIGVSKNTAWSMERKIRRALTESGDLFEKIGRLDKA